MIALLDAALTMGTGRARRDLLSPTSLVFGAGERTGILAARGSGKTAIARMLCGVIRPSAGHVLHEGRVSWPIGMAGHLHPDLTLARNLRLTAGLAGADPDAMMSIAVSLGGLGALMGEPMRNLSPAQRAAAGFCCSMAVECDLYVADDTTGFGSGQQRRISEAVLERRIEGKGLILLTSSGRAIRRFCDRPLVLLGTSLVSVRDAAAAEAALAEAQGLTFPQPDGQAA